MWGRNKKQSDDKAPQVIESLEALKRQIKQAYTTQRWNVVDENIVKLLTLLRHNNTVVGIAQSDLAELYAYWGITLQQERRYEEAYKQLQTAEKLLNLNIEQAEAFARQQEITLVGEGESLDMDVILQALEALAEAMIQRGASGTSGVMEQVVKVADIVGNRERQWNARYRLATYTSGLTDWEKLLPMAQELGQYAHRQKSLPSLLIAMRFVVEALIGLQRLDEAKEAQRFVVDLAQYLNDGSLPNEEAEMARLSAVR